MLRRHRNGLAFARGLALLAVVGVGFLLGPAARGADTQTFYMKDTAFEIPYAVNADQNLKQLYLHVSTDRKTYTQIAATAKRNDVFPFTAKGDGEYFFVVQVEDAGGVLTPPKAELGVPTLRVVVDTQKPQIKLEPVQPKVGRAAVAWQVADPNLDLRTLHLETKGPGEAAWTPQKITLLSAAQYGWFPTGNGPIEVRLSVKDLAGNEAAATTQVTPTAGAAAPPPSGHGDDAPVIYVKHKRFKLTYKIDGAGPSNVKEVQVWMARDKSQWSKYGPSAPPTGPFEISVTSAGRYGFTLRPISGVGRGPAPPRGGDAPQVWVEVDEKPPVVTVRNVQVGEGADAKVVVNWTATDEFLKEQPVTIYYREKDADQWRILKEHLENTGTANVSPPENVFEFFVKVEAVDKAGNKGSAQLKESIKVDTAIPMATGVGVEAVDSNPTGAQPPP